MVRRMWWHCRPETAVWGRARYLSFTEAPHNIESLRGSGEETFFLFETWRPEWGSSWRSPILQAGSFNHCTRALALVESIKTHSRLWDEPILITCLSQKLLKGVSNFLADSNKKTFLKCRRRCVFSEKNIWWFFACFLYKNCKIAILTRDTV